MVRKESLTSSRNDVTNSGTARLLSGILALVLVLVFVCISPVAAAGLIYHTEPSTFEYDGAVHQIYPYNAYGTGGIVLHVYLGDGKYELIPGSEYAIAPDRMKNAGTYQIQVVPLNEYSGFAPITIPYTATPKTISLTWSAESSFVFDGKTHEYRPVLSGVFGSDDVYLICEGDSNTNVGAYATKVVGLGGVDAPNYQLPSSGLVHMWDIHPLTVTISADDKTVVYGDKPPIYTAQYSESLNGENEQILQGDLKFACSYNQYDPAGTYTITPYGLTSENYTIKYSSGTLTVDKKALSRSSGTVSAKDKVFDSTTAATLAADVTFDGRVHSDDVTVAFTGTFDTPNVGQTKPVRINAALGGRDAGNYYLVTSTLPSVAYANITQKILAVPDGGRKEYTGEHLTSDLTNTSEYTVLQNDGGTEIGTYPVLLQKSSPNYLWQDIAGDVAEATFTITKSSPPAPTISPTRPQGGGSVILPETYIPTPTPEPTVEPTAEPSGEPTPIQNISIVVPVTELPTIWDTLRPFLKIIGLILGILLLLLLLLLLFMRRSEVLAIAYVLRKHAKVAHVRYAFGDSVETATVIRDTVTAAAGFKLWVHVPDLRRSAAEAVRSILIARSYPIPDSNVVRDVLIAAKRFHEIVK